MWQLILPPNFLFFRKLYEGYGTAMSESDISCEIQFVASSQNVMHHAIGWSKLKKMEIEFEYDRCDGVYNKIIIVL